MQPAEILLGGEVVQLLPAGAAWWPQRRMLAVADLHLEKGAAYARRGAFLPPYDTEATLDRLDALVRALAPARVVCLGDSFHDRAGAGALCESRRERVRALAASAEWIWLEGNHDAGTAAELGGTTAASLDLGGVVLRHVPAGEGAEVAGHLHPKARFRVGTRTLRLACFVHARERLLLPAFGSLTGGCNVLDPELDRLFDGKGAIYVTGERASWRIPRARLLPDPPSLESGRRPR